MAPSVVAGELVDAALRAAETLGKDVADVPVVAIAHEAGISRSTLLRRLGRSRAALDAAVRTAGIDPGGQPPVRVRALDAAALISGADLAAATMEAVSARADCSVYSLPRGTLPSTVTQVAAKCAQQRWLLPVLGWLPVPAALLIRPDGYVAWASRDESMHGLDAAART
jgi:hypothetical protein